MSCYRARRLIVPYLDAELRRDEDKEVLLLHLEKCDSCNNLLLELKTTSQLTSSLSSPVKEPRLPATIQDTLEAFIYQQSLIPPPLIPGYIPKLAVGMALVVCIILAGFHLSWGPVELPLVSLKGQVAYLDREANEWSFVDEVDFIKEKRLFVTSSGALVAAHLDTAGRIAVVGESAFWPIELQRNRLTAGMKVRLALRQGTILIKAERAPIGSRLSVEASKLTAVAKGTAYMVTAFGDREATVTVLEGKVRVTPLEPHRRSVLLCRGQRIDLKAFSQEGPMPQVVSEEELNRLKLLSKDLKEVKFEEYKTKPEPEEGKKRGWLRNWLDTHRIDFWFEQ